jgi:VWFA-related protein
MRRLSAALVAAIACAAVVARTQEQSFRRNVEGVRLDVRIVDRDGRLVRDLTKDDVVVLEDGKEQAITSFELIDIPVTSEARAPIVDPDVASNAAAAEGRVYLIVLDDLHTHPLRSVTVRALAREFIERNFGPNDLGAIIAASGRREMATEFTTNRGRLLAGAERFEGGFSAGVYCGSDKEPCQADEHRTMRYLATLAKWLDGVDDRRKALLFISEGFNSGISDVFAAQSDPDGPHVVGSGGHGPTAANLADVSAAAGDARDVIDAATRSSVSIYAIDPIGLPGAPAPGIKPVTTLGDDDPGRIVIAQQGLESLAESTGGFALVHSNRFTDAFARVVSETSSYYLVGYTSSNPKPDGKFRSVRVHVKRPGLTARTRAGYVARNEKPSTSTTAAGTIAPELAAALSSPLQIPGLTMTMSATAFKGEKSKASVQVVIEALSDHLPIAIAIVAANPDGDIKAEEHGTLDMKAPAAAGTASVEPRVRLVSRLTLSPGRYQLRAAGRDSSGISGSVHYDLDIADFGKQPLALAGVTIASAAVASVPTSGTDRSWRERTLGPPTTQRMFSSRDQLSLFAEIYDNGGKSGDPIEVTTTVTSDVGDTMLTRVEKMLAQPGKNKSTMSEYMAIVPLNDLKPGRYVLAVEAHRTANRSHHVLRQIPFTVN